MLTPKLPDDLEKKKRKNEKTRREEEIKILDPKRSG
jgi:hypothetical protein